MSDDVRVPDNVRAAFADRALVSAPSLAKLLSIDIKTLKKHVESGELPGRVKGTGSARQHWVFTIHDVAEFLKPRAPLKVNQTALAAHRLFKPSGKPAPRSGMLRLRKRQGPYDEER